jgi:osmotically inducible protein OsmC
MATAESTASAVWEGGLADGSGSVSAASGVLMDAPVTWAQRVARSEDMTSPEELIAAAHAACLSMALSLGLEESGASPERLKVSAACTFDRVGDGFGITRMALDVRGRVPGIDQAAFGEAAREAAENCPVSQALNDNVDIAVSATLV